MPGDDDRSARKPEGTVSALLREMAPAAEDLVGATVALDRIEAKLGQAQ